MSVRVERDGDVATYTVDLTQLPPADAVFDADCARAYLRDGYPELHFGQRHPLRGTLLVRLLVVRYAPDQFSQRADSNEDFRQGLEAWLSESGGRGEPGYFVRALEEAGDEPPPTAAQLEAEGEFMMRTGHRGAIIFMSMPSLDRHLIVAGKASHVAIHTPVEVRMPIRVLADLLASWREVAKGG